MGGPCRYMSACSFHMAASITSKNLECDNEASLRPLFQQLLSKEEWDAAEAWRQERLVCRVIRFANGRIDCGLGCPSFPIYQGARGLN